MKFIRDRMTRWAVNGALILSALSVVLGTLFTVVITLAERSMPASPGAVAWLILRFALIWGIGALPFGAILGIFASLIWSEQTTDRN